MGNTQSEINKENLKIDSNKKLENPNNQKVTKNNKETIQNNIIDILKDDEFWLDA
jgi:hypothetical protein